MEKLNRQNTEHSQEKSDADSLRQDDRGRPESAALILGGSEHPAAPPGDRKKATREVDEEEEAEEEAEAEEEEGNIFEDSESEEEKQDEKVEDDEKRKRKGQADSPNSETSSSVAADICLASLPPQRYSQRKLTSTRPTQADPSMKMGEAIEFALLISTNSSEEADVAACSKRRVTEEDLVKDDLKKSRVEGSKSENAGGEVAEKEGEPTASKAEEVNTEEKKETEDSSELKEFLLGKRHRYRLELHIKLMLHVWMKTGSACIQVKVKASVCVLYVFVPGCFFSCFSLISVSEPAAFADFIAAVKEINTRNNKLAHIPANVSLACQWTQRAGQIMRHWHAAIFIHFVSKVQVLFLRAWLSFHFSRSSFF